jgi:hypothetical protein
MRRTPLATSLLLLGLVLAGCGDGEQPDRADPTSSEPASSSSASTEPTGAAPATGVVLERKQFRFRLPQGWVDDTRDPTMPQGRLPSKTDWNQVTINLVPADGEDVREMTPVMLKVFKVFAKKGRRLPFTEWAGEASYHLAGAESSAGYAEEFGAVWKDVLVIINFEFDTKKAAKQLSPAERQEVIESIEASWEWK